MFRTSDLPSAKAIQLQNLQTRKPLFIGSLAELGVSVTFEIHSHLSTDSTGEIYTGRKQVK